MPALTASSPGLGVALLTICLAATATSCTSSGPEVNGATLSATQLANRVSACSRVRTVSPSEATCIVKRQLITFTTFRPSQGEAPIPVTELLPSVQVVGKNWLADVPFEDLADASNHYVLAARKQAASIVASALGGRVEVTKMP